MAARTLGLNVFPLKTHYRGTVESLSVKTLLRHSMGPENNVRLEGCRIMEGLLPYNNNNNSHHTLIW